MVLINEQWVLHSRVAKVMIMGQQLNKSGYNIANNYYNSFSMVSANVCCGHLTVAISIGG